ncbi:MAG: ribonuclease P protein component [Bacteroidetes bacterium]|nr:ribonuclease P protein component [Bacteroidota bacterium]
MQTFSKTERLCSKILIDRLFENGKSFHHSPVRISWLEINESSAPIRVVISVPKRSFKKAVDRNKLKRQIREVYRKEKQKVYDVMGEKKIVLILIYTAKTKLEFKELEQKIIEALNRLSKTLITELK